jgi:hypothetical protein
MTGRTLGLAGVGRGIVKGNFKGKGQECPFHTCSFAAGWMPRWVLSFHRFSFLDGQLTLAFVPKWAYWR